jgi:hypothetical protein
MKVNDIVIVGGGSAGWMTAAILKHDFPQKTIRLIESPNIPTVGVGESTYDAINSYLGYIEIDRDDFFKHTDASIKLGIEFVNFYQNDGSSFLYPFGSPYVDYTRWGLQDWMIRKYKYPSTPVSDFADSYFPAAHLIKHDSFCENKQGELPRFDPVASTAFHFDAIKFAEWLRERYCIPRGVIHIVDEVESVDVEDNRVVGLKMSSGDYIVSDLFVDCTGFKSLLLGQSLQEPFIDFSDELPNSNAWATQVPYDDKIIELKTVTRCTALKSGWAWNIPLYSRLGAGYVYSDKFVSHDDALLEFKEYLASNLMDIPKSQNTIENLEFKNIKMRVGVHEKVWVNNVVAIGLSAAFIEPLESNGLFTVHEFLFNLVRALNRDAVTSWDIHIFNEAARETFEAFSEFIKIHYALSIRDDSEYWKENSTRSYNFKGIGVEDSSAALMHYLYNMKTKIFLPEDSGSFPSGITCISTGMNFNILDNVSARKAELRNNEDYKESMKPWFERLDQKKVFWDSIAANSPKLSEYLRDKYHGGIDG